MFLVREVWSDAKKIFRNCDETLLYEKIGDAYELLASKGETDALVGYVDICVDCAQCITLPREVETILAVNMDGHPTIGRNPLHTFHLNGPGDFITVWRSWTDLGNFPTYRDLPCPGKLVAYLDSQADEGTELRVFGHDSQNRPLRTEVGGVWSDGYLVPTVFGFALPDTNAPIISRISHIVKANTVGDVRLSSFDNSSTVNSSTGTLLGIFEPNETKPMYRRIKLWRSANWVRICYRKRSYRLFSQYDRILLHSRLALIMAMRAVQFYDDTDLSNATSYEAHAVRILTEKEATLEGPALTPIQVDDRNSIKNNGYDDVD